MEALGEFRRALEGHPMSDQPQTYVPGAVSPPYAPGATSDPPLLCLAQRMQHGAERAHVMCDALEQVLVQLTGPRPTPAPEREEDGSPGALPVLVATQERVESAHNRLEGLVDELRETLGA